MKNRLSHLPDGQFRKYLDFARAHPGIVSVHHLLQKLAIYDFVAPVVERSGARQILEIGCGIGIHSALLSAAGHVQATELEVPGSFVGADRGVADARRRVFDALASGPVAFTHNDGHRLPFTDGAFDLVFHNSVIEHVPSILEFNHETLRVLRPGGLCICITGTPALCWQRRALGLLKWPGSLLVAIAREALPPRWRRALARTLLRAVGMDEARIRKAETRLGSIADRARKVCPQAPTAVGTGAAPAVDLPALHPRLQHFLDAPAYNRMVFDEMAQERGLSPERLGSQVVEHFARSRWNRIRYALTPRTHGQHYRDWREEKREWRVDRWVEQFTEAGYVVEDIVPYRFHHIFETMPLRKWDGHVYFRGVPLIHALLRRRLLRPSWASEILILARKPARP